MRKTCRGHAHAANAAERGELDSLRTLYDEQQGKENEDCGLSGLYRFTESSRLDLSFLHAHNGDSPFSPIGNSDR